MRFNLFAATAAVSILAMAGTAQADVVKNTDLGTVLPPGSTTTDSTGTRSTNANAAVLASEAIAANEWQQRNVRSNGVVGITNDYARDGNGSIYFSTDGTGASKADMEMYFSTPKLLSDFDGGTYDWRKDGTSTVGQAPAPAYRLSLQTASGLYAGYAIFEPYLNGNVPVDTWETETIDTSTSQFWWNNTNVALGAPCANRQACMYTIDQVAGLDANDGLLVTGFSVGVGSGWNQGPFKGAVDNVGYSFNGADKKYNFEVAAVPEPATWAMMIMGFGGVGATIRNRRRILATA